MLTDNKQTNVKVVCRFRPINQKQRSMGTITIHELLDDKTITIKDNTKNDKITHLEPLIFSFDKVFDCHSSQSQVYTYAASSVIDDIIEGFNGTIFAYGQTSSGKTYTMEGQISQKIVDQSGIIPRMVIQIFNTISRCSQKLEFKIKVSIVELYKQKLRDLINTTKNDLKIRSDKKKGIFIQNVTQTYISSPEEVYQLIQIARSTRTIASTNMNEQSSRSHLLFILTLSQSNQQQLSAKTGKLYLVDLAGSQKVSKTGAQGKILDQAKKINLSLTVLGKVINALTDGKSFHIPYRDSKLTRVLQQSLGGNSKTTLIVTCSPHINNIGETISSLRFGVSAKNIKNKPQINKQLTVAQLQSLLQKAENTLSQKQKYINQLRNYILIDLKQKSLPIPQSEIGSIQKNEDYQLDKVNELQRQIEIQRNLNQSLQSQSRKLEEKNQKIILEKQSLEKQLYKCKNTIADLEKHIKNIQNLNKIETNSTTYSLLTVGSTSEQHIQKIQLPTTEQLNIDLITDQNRLQLDKISYTQLLQQYQQTKQKLTTTTQQTIKNQHHLIKKLTQLQNNLIQLTHQYYNLLMIHQRYKFQNKLIIKKYQQKDLYIKTLKEKIIDLEDLNRSLQQQKWVDNQEYLTQENNKNTIKYAISYENNKKFDQFCARGTHRNNATLVKIVRGGKQKQQNR